jgi:hypothetical protein
MKMIQSIPDLFKPIMTAIGFATSVLLISNLIFGPAQGHGTLRVSCYDKAGVLKSLADVKDQTVVFSPNPNGPFAQCIVEEK